MTLSQDGGRGCGRVTCGFGRISHNVSLLPLGFSLEVQQGTEVVGKFLERTSWSIYIGPG